MSSIKRISRRELFRQRIKALNETFSSCVKNGNVCVVDRKDLAEFLGKENNLGINNIVRDHTPYKMVKSFKRGGKRYGVKRELKPNEYIITRKYD